jgi:predicted Ser/Thr protein kinase
MEPMPQPDTIGRYRIVGVLDSGGQAVVYRAAHPTLPRDVAIKVAHEPSTIDRSLLKGDAELLCLLEHPNLVRVHDLDLHDGRPFVVMEFVRGRNLQQVADQSRPSPYQAALWMAVIARALAYVHRCGVVHQDIKPKNILIDESGCPRLIDFGVARWRNVWSEGQAGPSGGTLAFMAPEQARGESERVGAAADIFGLGGTLYFLLTGEAPFEGKTKNEQWRRASRCEFDHAALRARKVPRALERVVLKAMAADPKDRFASAESMASALDGYLHRPRRLAIQAAALLVVALAMVGWWSWPRLIGDGAASAPNRGPTGTSVPQPKAATPAAAPAPALPLKIESLQVELHGRTKGDPTGLIGVNAFAGRFGEDVRIQARFNEPAYCYLLALNPDGKAQPCYPANQDVRPTLKATIDFPPNPDDGFSLTDGIGTQGFVVIASLNPLPPYSEWLRKTRDLPWRKAESDNVWRYDGHSFDPTNRDRGEVRRLADLPLPFAETCRALQSAPRVEAIQAVAFPVQAAGALSGPKGPG